MTVHYMNANREEVFISGVHHLQNIDNETWVALVDGGELCLKTSRIEGIYHEDTKTRKTGWKQFTDTFPFAAALEDYDSCFLDWLSQPAEE